MQSEKIKNQKIFFHDSFDMKKVFNKLVRDKMVDVYKHDIENQISASDYKVRYLSREETLEELKNKLIEEAKEVFEAYKLEDKNPLKEELADLIEVIDAILYHNNISLDEVLKIRDVKKEKRGGFEDGLYLESIDYFEEHL
jgi:predicted house-cleaning noncanonical NTP pyrophosphatase (MazG superfamily)